jgi:hypothetical protein
MQGYLAEGAGRCDNLSQHRAAAVFFWDPECKSVDSSTLLSFSTMREGFRSFLLAYSDYLPTHWQLGKPFVSNTVRHFPGPEPSLQWWPALTHHSPGPPFGLAITSQDWLWESPTFRNIDATKVGWPQIAA